MSAVAPSNAGRRLKWLHRIGYVTTAVFCAELVALAAVAGPEIYRIAALWAEQRRENRTREGPLPAGKALTQELALLPPLPSLGRDALRFGTHFSLSDKSYALSLALPANAPRASGEILRMSVNGDKPILLSAARFTMPRDAYRRMTQQLDEQTDNWNGKGYGGCLDGAATAFERVRGQKISSGVGLCVSHYTDLSRLIYRSIKPYAPCDALPEYDLWVESEDWAATCAGKRTAPTD
ncbi:hypothetical protein ACFOMD_06605 [Sphingoaurantiacus capsulatus]|uniref:Uncharacterized protein n=1 Tax=Sphingoaurantiacus capsulatus TaxID=1771310 RepID=A0ABV7XAB6_9SPHN